MPHGSGQRHPRQALATQNAAVDNLRVVFAAGDTGGHIYPAVAIADELQLTKPFSKILFFWVHPTAWKAPQYPPPALTSRPNQGFYV
ncbi:hypothetical protein PS1_047093 [Malus domestica]